MHLGRVGVRSGRLQRRPTADALEVVAEWEELAYQARWVPESPGGKDVLTFSAVLLGGSTSIPVATGIAIIWASDPVAMMNASRTLVEAFPGRFLLGIGVSHRSTAVLRGHEYDKPLSATRAYLEAMNDAPFDGHSPTRPPMKVVAAPATNDGTGGGVSRWHPSLSTSSSKHNQGAFVGEPLPDDAEASEIHRRYIHDRPLTLTSP